MIANYGGMRWVWPPTPTHMNEIIELGMLFVFAIIETVILFTLLHITTLLLYAQQHPVPEIHVMKHMHVLIQNHWGCLAMYSRRPYLFE